MVRWEQGQPEDLPRVPAAISDYRRRVGLDYGKIDHVEHEGRQFVLDVNKTIGGSASDESDSALSRYLTAGLASGVPLAYRGIDYTAAVYAAAKTGGNP